MKPIQINRVSSISTQEMDMQENNDRYPLVATCMLFFCLGLVAAAIGPILPVLAENTGSSLSVIGSVFSALFLGSLLAQIIAGPVIDRVGPKPVLFLGAIFLAIGTAGIMMSNSLTITLIFSFLIGLGGGSLDVGGNVLVAQTYLKRSVAALNLLHFFFGVGAFVGPMVIGLSWKIWETSQPMVLAMASLALIQVFFISRIPVRRISVRKEMQSNIKSGFSIYQSGLLWTLGFILLVYVGVENGVGGWTAVYMEQTTGANPGWAALVASCFWLALAVGRMAGATFGPRLAPAHLLLASLGGSCIGGFAMAVTTGLEIPTIMSLLLIGFSYGSIYPVIVALTTSAFSAQSGKAISVVMAMGSIGAMLIPWWQGTILDQVGTSAGAWFVAFGNLVMLLVFAGLQARKMAFQAGN